jgi:carboxymethylenebutenolidase
MCDLLGCGTHQNLPPIVIDPEQRRLFLKGLVSLPLASVLAFPELSRAAAGRLDTVSIILPTGQTVSAAVALPEADKAPAIILIHEWWGLNDQIKSVAAELANMGYVALAVDLYNGKSATDPEGAKALMQAVDAQQATTTLVEWNNWLRNHEQSTGKIGTVGWCFGGGWSLNASIAARVDATVIYYGNVAVSADQLKNLRGPVLGHFATKDGWINQAMVDGFENEATKAGKTDSLSVHWYEADHAFANPTSSRYDAEDAALSWERTSAFFKQHLT